MVNRESVNWNGDMAPIWTCRETMRSRPTFNQQALAILALAMRARWNSDRESFRVILHGLKAHVRMGHRAVGFLKALAKEHQTDLSGQRVEVIRDLIIDGVWKPAESFGFACRIDDTLVQARAASVNVVTNALSRRGASPHMRRKPFATASHDGAGLADGEGD